MLRLCDIEEWYLVLWNKAGLRWTIEMGCCSVVSGAFISSQCVSEFHIAI